MSFDVTLEIRRGDWSVATGFSSGGGIAALFGPSGSGKTTILDAMAGLVRPQRGRIVVGGTVLFDSMAGIDLPPEQRACGYVFQDLRLFPHLSVRDNLLYGWRLAAPEQRWMTLQEACGFLGIAHLLDRSTRTLSGGEAQRVAIGRTLLRAPRFLLMDEPLSSLDSARRDDILRVIERIRAELALPILLVSHDRAEVERLADTIVAIGSSDAHRT